MLAGAGPWGGGCCSQAWDCGHLAFWALSFLGGTDRSLSLVSGGPQGLCQQVGGQQALLQPHSWARGAQVSGLCQLFLWFGPSFQKHLPGATKCQALHDLLAPSPSRDGQPGRGSPA